MGMLFSMQWNPYWAAAYQYVSYQTTNTMRPLKIPYEINFLQFVPSPMINQYLPL